MRCKKLNSKIMNLLRKKVKILIFENVSSVFGLYM